MQRLSSVIAVTLLLLITADACSQQNDREDISTAAVFQATTPCGQGVKPLPGIPAGADCEVIKWELTLYKDRYRLHCSYGLPSQGNTGLAGGGKTVSMEGSWKTVQGTPVNPQAVVYLLHDSKTDQSIAFIKLGDALLHLLDNERRLMIGNAGWSYTLNSARNQ